MRLKNTHNKHTLGFTIVELLLVVVVIGILAAIVISAYTGVQAHARESKIAQDLSLLERAIHAARTSESKPLFNVTNSGGTAQACTIKPNNTNLAELPKTDACWVNYEATLNAISDAGGVDVRGLIDPWGRPYYIDENENENNNGSCIKDVIGSFRQPFQTGWVRDNSINIQNSLPSC